MFLEDLSEGDTTKSDEMPLRVYAEEIRYGFSTTPAGYFRFLAEIENLDYVNDKFSSAAIYTLMAISNCWLWLIMFLRMLIMMILALVGFLIVLSYVFGKEGSTFWSYKNWVIMYAAMASIQVILSITNRLLMESIINS